MKKTVIILLSLILILAIVLVYKIINKSNEETDVASINTQQDNISFINNGYDSTFSEEVQANMLATDVLTTYKNNKQESVEENNKPIIKDNIQNQYNKVEVPTQQPSEAKPQEDNNYQETINNKYNSNKQEENDNTSNKSETTVNNKEEEEEEEKLEYVVQLNTELENKFKGYGNNNIYVLEEGGAFIQTDWTSQKKSLTNPRVELRYYVGEKQFKLYVEGMKSDVQVASLYARSGYAVFPQLEYSKYSAKVESFISSGILNSSMSKPYMDKLEDIKNNWTKLGQGRVICVSNTSYWEQIDNSTGTFKENAKVLVGSYNGNYYMLIEGIDNPILVRQYDTNS